jgi:hypothetical protein
MSKMATCVCGQPVHFPDDFSSFPIHCPVCGRVVELPVSQETPSPSELEPLSSCSPDAASAAVNTVAEPPILLRLLLDPTTIRRLLFFGGGLSVLGLIAWLVSLGVFDDPRILAVALGAGTLALLASGWGVVLRTQYRLAGQALTFLACVVAPLNLWFYDAQGLLTVDGHLWVGGLVCSVIYAMTVWKLRDPLFLYAVEAGITLTVLLLLGDLQRVTDSSALCLAMVVLATVSIHAEAAFDPNHPIFARKRFGLPLFFSGQVQLAIGTIGLLVLQCLNWVLHPTGGDWSHSQLATTPWLAGGLWFVAAYLWGYSDLAVRRLSVYTFLAAVATVLAEATLLYPVLPLEVLIIALSVTAAGARLLSHRTTEPAARWSSVTSLVSVTVSGVAFALGVFQHLHQMTLIATNETGTPSLLALAMFVVAANLCLQGMLQQKSKSKLLLGCWTCSGLSLWLSLMLGLGTAGFLTVVEQTPILMLVPLAIVVLAPRLLTVERVNPALLAAHATAILGMILSAVTVKNPNEWTEILVGRASNFSTLLSGSIFAELATLCFATKTQKRARWLSFGCGCLWTLAAGWKVLVFVDLPEACFGPLLASVGLILTINGRLRTLSNPAIEQTSEERLQPNKTSAWIIAGDLNLTLGELFAFFQILPSLFGSLGSTSTGTLIAAVSTAGLAVVGAIITPSRSIRGWHRFAAAAIATSVTIVWIRTQHLAPYQKLELVLEILGLAWLGAGFVGRLKETNERKETWVSLALWLGSLASTLPVLICTLMHRWSQSGPSLGDELSLITITALMVTIGCILQVRSTTTFGGLTLGLYLAVLFGHLAYHPQIAVGVYLAAGGALIFLTGVLLSVYRDRLLALPSKISNREGLFRIIDWR